MDKEIVCKCGKPMKFESALTPGIEESLWHKYNDGKRDATKFIQFMIDTRSTIMFPKGTYSINKRSSVVTGATQT